MAWPCCLMPLHQWANDGFKFKYSFYSGTWSCKELLFLYVYSFDRDTSTELAFLDDVSSQKTGPQSHKTTALPNQHRKGKKPALFEKLLQDHSSFCPFWEENSHSVQLHHSHQSLFFGSEGSFLIVLFIFFSMLPSAWTGEVGVQSCHDDCWIEWESLHIFFVSSQLFKSS